MFTSKSASSAFLKFVLVTVDIAYLDGLTLFPRYRYCSPVRQNSNQVSPAQSLGLSPLWEMFWRSWRTPQPVYPLHPSFLTLTRRTCPQTSPSRRELLPRKCRRESLFKTIASPSMLSFPTRNWKMLEQREETDIDSSNFVELGSNQGRVAVAMWTLWLLHQLLHVYMPCQLSCW